MKIILILVLFSSGCSNVRYLEDGQKLYTGSKINIESEEKIANKNEVSRELERVLRPRPNERLLIWRPRLWFYNIAGDDPQGPLRRYLKNRLGRPPVLWENFNGPRAVRLMENRLFNLGYFDGQVEFIPNERSRTARAEFLVQLKPAYTINELRPLQAKSLVAESINSTLDETLLRTHRDYSLARLRQERERISNILRDDGFFFFNPDFIVFRADTTVGNRQVNLALTLSSSAPSNAFKQYQIRNTIAEIDHSTSPGIATPLDAKDSISVTDDFLLINNQNFIKPKVLRRTIFFEEGELYNTRDHDLSLNHLMGLGVFRFVNIRFYEINQEDSNNLDVKVMLNPMEKKTLGVEIRGVSKSTNFAGPGLTASFTNRNFFGGAEHFTINVDGSYEILMGSKYSGVSSFEAGASSELIIPRFVSPFRINSISPLFIPKTRMVMGFNFFRRTDAFSVSSIRSQFGYQWNWSITTMHRFNPLVFSIFSLRDLSPQYSRFFSVEVLLRRELFEQFLLGSEYSYYYNSQLRRPRKHSWYFNFNADLSGNTLYFLFNTLNLGTSIEDGSYGIFNQSFSQYTKADFDVRYYLDMGHNQTLATRLIAGAGIPYGNSSTLPYVKLFTIGGSNSIRAFQPRSLGPGAYLSPDTLLSSLDIYQSGELKLELNVEYRFAFTNIIKGALFADAGNVWNFKERQNVPGGAFKRSDFLNQIALGTGAGIRFDLTFFILRLDLAFPLAVPYDSSERFFQAIRPLDRQWRADNLLLNFAIGYPF